MDRASDDSDRESNGPGKRPRDAEENIEDILAHMLSVGSIKEITTLARSPLLHQLCTRIQNIEPNKNTITPDDPEYKLLEECNAMVVDLEIEKTKVYRFVRAHYRHRFPELESLIVDSVTFAQVVNIIQNGVEDLTSVVDKLSELLPSQVLAVIIVTASTTKGIPFSSEDIGIVLEGCEEMEILENVKQIILEYVHQRMMLVAPNLCNFIGPAIASQLFGITGSLQKLSEMAPDDIARLGKARATASGFAASIGGFILNADMVRSQPAEIRHKAIRVVCNKLSLAVRVDATRHAPDGQQGVELREQVRAVMERWQQPPLQPIAAGMYDRRTRYRRAEKVAKRRAQTAALL